MSWAKLCPRTIQSGAKTAAGKTGKGNRYLKAVLGDAAAGAAKTDTFLGERYRRIVKRRGKLKALVAVARSILVIVWHLLSNPGAHFHDLGSDYYTNRIAPSRRPATTSANSKRSATRSPSNQSPKTKHSLTLITPRRHRYFRVRRLRIAIRRMPIIAMLRDSRDASALHHEALRTLTAASTIRALTRLRTTTKALQTDPRPLSETIDAITSSTEEVRHQAHRVHALGATGRPTPSRRPGPATH